MTDAVTIYHNPDCGTSRKVLATIEEAGIEAAVIEYRKVGWTRALLVDLLALMGANPRDLLRERGTPAVALGLLDPHVTDGAILDAMVEHPILVERPIVMTPAGATLCRPAEKVLALL
jgi:arsenate reductase